MKTLSVVIPNFNNARFLPKCLDSVLSQDYPLEEIVIYDDCSTDGSRQLLDKYAGQDSRIRLMLADVNRGVSYARDTAIRSCRSEYVTTLDADDFYYDDKKLSREMAKINASSTPACAFSQTVLTDEDGNVACDMTLLDLQKDFRFRTVTQTIGIHVARDFCFPLSAYIEVGGYVHDMKLFEDWDLSLKLLSKCPFLFSGGYGTAYRQKDGGLSRVDQKKIVAAKIRAFRQGGKYLSYTFSERFVFYMRTYICALIDTYLAKKNRK
ncbi:MAG: glycosyltransferase family 2 protein [Lachnospiraceae bacterium]|nr:glycosyltransferase family 2 protein [Lachnospiraceae bacterium]